jgi:predicted RecA/RadA family phage recombinase
MTYGVYTPGTAGDEVSSTYEGRHLTFDESQLVHPSHTDGFVNSGDPVVVGENIVGVAFTSAAAATDLIAIDTEGIWQLSVVATNEDGNIAVAVGDELFINTTTAIISKNPNKNTQQRFGYALYPITSGATDVIPVKVHFDPDDATELVGVSGAPLTTALANTFREYRYQCSATSGASQGIYIRQYLTGAGTLTANALRAYTDIVGVQIGNAYGAHITLGLGESTTIGKFTGLGCAVRATFGLPDGAAFAGGVGTPAAIQAEFFSFGAGSTLAAAHPTQAFIRCVNDGNATGIAALDDTLNLLTLTGGAIAGGNIVEASATEANYAYSARCNIHGVTMYMMFASAVG